MINLKDVIYRKDDIFQKIIAHRRNIKLLLDFATGYKKLYRDKPAHRHFSGSEWRLISTIKNLHIQCRELHKEYKILDKVQKKLEGANHAKN